jgi:hypothetical protein
MFIDFADAKIIEMIADARRERDNDLMSSQKWATVMFN